jgi:hypothetical protein
MMRRRSLDFRSGLLRPVLRRLWGVSTWCVDCADDIGAFVGQMIAGALWRLFHGDWLGSAAILARHEPEKLPGSFGGEDARDAGEVRGDGNAGPRRRRRVKHGADRFGGIVAKLEDQDSAIAKLITRFQHQSLIHFNATWSGKKRRAWFVVANFALERGGVGIGDVRRIADDQIEERLGRIFKGGQREQIGLDEADAVGEVMARGVASRNFEGGAGSIRCDDFSVGQFVGERDGKASRTRADIGDIESLAR